MFCLPVSVRSSKTSAVHGRCARRRRAAPREHARGDRPGGGQGTRPAARARKKRRSGARDRRRTDPGLRPRRQEELRLLELSSQRSRRIILNISSNRKRHDVPCSASTSSCFYAKGAGVGSTQKLKQEAQRVHHHASLLRNYNAVIKYYTPRLATKPGTLTLPPPVAAMLVEENYLHVLLFTPLFFSRCILRQ